ncbi:MAG: helix-turn-helix transcriptional regulator [Lachnospiraceae bacterium]|nr:helix-turn-helix transcriptional regulator [Lachnospiraceae bacterium]MBQ2100639.1 helix-turn-helix transcriptional regulator [Lachnospiraceae bacterium]
MSLGQNISFLRKQKKITQERFAERMNVTRQTVSRWESDEITPELSKLVDMSEFFACNLDALVKENLSRQEDIYSEVQVKKVPAFRYASYAIISREPESDALGYMQRWAEAKGLQNSDQVKFIGWDFPFVSQEQQTRFGMHGYVAACVLPDDFAAEDDGACISQNFEAEYATVTIKEPFIQPFERIPNAYKLIMDYLQANNFKEKGQENIIGCFEREYEKNGVTYMDIYIHVASVTKADAFSSFN